MPAIFSSPSPSPGIKTMTGLRFIGLPEQDTFTDRPSTLIFLVPDSRPAAAFRAAEVTDDFVCASETSLQPVSPVPVRAQHSAITADALNVGFIFSSSEKAMWRTLL